MGVAGETEAETVTESALRQSAEIREAGAADCAEAISRPEKATASRTATKSNASGRPERNLLAMFLICPCTSKRIASQSEGQSILPSCTSHEPMHTSSFWAEV